MAFSEIALKAFQNVVGEENATSDPVKCQAYSRVQWTPDGILQRDQIGLAMRPACVVMPGSTAEVQVRAGEMSQAEKNDGGKDGRQPGERSVLGVLERLLLPSAARKDYYCQLSA